MLGLLLSVGSVPFAIRHLDSSYTIGSNATTFVGDPGEGNGETVFFTTAGTDDLSGRWEIHIASLAGERALREHLFDDLA